MRPLPVAAVAGAPDFVAGVAIIRGDAVPVVDAARLLTGEGEPFAAHRADVLMVPPEIGPTLGGLASPSPRSPRS